MSSGSIRMLSAADAIPWLTVAKEAVGAVPTIGPILQGSVGALVEILKIVQKVGNSEQLQSMLLERIYTIYRILEPYISPRKAQSLRRGPLLYRLEKLSRDIMACEPHLVKLKSFHRYQKYLKQDAIAGLMGDIERTIQSAIQTFELEGSIRQEALLDSIHTVVESTNASVNYLVQRQENEVLSADFLDSSSPKCLENTRVDLLNELWEWSHGRMHHERRILWLHGPPGSGKSTVARTIASELQGKGMLAASFFFSRDHDKRRNPHSVFPSIARQLALFSHDFKTRYDDVQQKYSNGGIQDLELQLKHLISEPLGLISPPDRRWVIILDALDECEDESGAIEILTLLGLRLDKLPHVQFLITSRPEYRIKSRFESLDTASLKPHAQPINLHEINIKTVSGDIRRYLDYELGGEWARREGWFPNKRDLDLLTDVADGLFIYAATCVKLIKSSAKRSETLRHLIEGKQGGAPLDALNSLYLQIIKNALEKRDEGSIETFRHVVGAIVYLRNPLSSRDLSHLLGMQDGDIRTILVPLHTVIFVPDSTSSEIKFYHQSFRDFLVTSPRGLSFEQRNTVQDTLFLHDQSTHDTYLAENCFKTFNVVLHRNMSGVDDLTKLNSEIPDLISRVHKNLPLHARYACRYWSSHLRGSYTVRSTTLCDQLEDWTQRHMMSWLESLSLCNQVHESVASLKEAERWYKECPLPRKDVTQLLADGQRFVQMFIEPIESSAGHIYVSALPFTPDCQLRSQYFSNSHDSVRVLQGRSTEWPPLLLNIHGHEGPVFSVAFSPDGGRVVSGSEDETVRIWSSETGKLLSTLEGHTNFVRSVAFSPDGRQLASGSHDSTMRIWSSETGKLLFTLEHMDAVLSVGFSPDGRRVVSGSDDKMVRIWSSETGELLSVIEGHTNDVTAVAFSPDGRQIASGSEDRTVRIWSSETSEFLFSLEGLTDIVDSLRFSPDGTRLMTDAYNGVVGIWLLKTGKLLTTLDTEAYSTSFSPDGGRIVSGSHDKTVRIWSSETGKLLSTLEGHTDTVYSVTFSPNGKRIASGSHDKTVKIWSSETGKFLSSLEKHSDLVTSVALSPDGRRVVSSSDDRMVRIWSSGTGKCLSTLKGHTGSVRSVAFSPDGRRVVSGSWDHGVRIWSSETGKLLSTLEWITNSDSITSVMFSPDGRRVVAGTYDRAVRIWSSETGEPLSTLEDYTGSIRELALSLGGDSVSGGHDSNKLSIALHIGDSGWVCDQTRFLCWLPLRNRPSRESAGDTSMDTMCSGSKHGVVTILDFSHLIAIS